MSHIVTCPDCKGKGTLAYTIQESGKPERAMEMKCLTCKGAKTVNSVAAEAFERMQRAMREMWCRCGNPSGEVSYHPDAPGSKHHWTCDDCGKVTQIG
jgi:uncharacterized protein YbaR (Trm112 family)